MFYNLDVQSRGLRINYGLNFINGGVHFDKKNCFGNINVFRSDA